MITNIILLSLICFGVHAATREGAIFEYWQEIVNDDDGNQICEFLNPFTECLTCMPSFWGVCYFYVLGLVPLYAYAAFVVNAGILLMVSIAKKEYKQYSLINTLYIFLLFFVLLVSAQPQTVFFSIICTVGANFLIYEFINK